jgi:hypothetical protein
MKRAFTGGSNSMVEYDLPKVDVAGSSPVSRSKYNVYATPEKVYIEDRRGCVARLCKVSAEFFFEQVWIENCTFKKFQEEAFKRGYEIRNELCPVWAKR